MEMLVWGWGGLRSGNVTGGTLYKSIRLRVRGRRLFLARLLSPLTERGLPPSVLLTLHPHPVLKSCSVGSAGGGSTRIVLQLVVAGDGED